MEFIEKVLINTIVVAIGFLLSYSGLTKEIVLAYIMLLSLDYITGIMASYKICDEITSNKMIRGLFYKISLLFVLFGLGFFAKMIMMDTEAKEIFFIPILIMLGAGELFSLVANVHCIKTGKRHKEEIVVTDYILKFIKKIIDKLGA